MTRPYRTRKLLSVAEQNTLWAQRQRGATAREIAQAVGTVQATINLCVVRHGGVAPAARHRALTALTEREEISRGIAAQEGVRTLARRLGRDPGTISRESGAMAAAATIARAKRTDGRGRAGGAPSAVGWPNRRAWVRWSRRSCASSGRPSKLQHGCGARIPMTR